MKRFSIINQWTHALCPKTPDTWCKLQKPALSQEEYNHEDHNHVVPMLTKELKQTYRDLADPVLLTKCLHGGTQNPSESFSNIVWSPTPKTTFVIRNPLELGAYDAVASYNEGNIVKWQVLQKLGIVQARNLLEAMKNFHEIRIKKADKAVDKVEQKCRQKQMAAKRRLEDEAQEDPDSPTYWAGIH